MKSIKELFDKYDCDKSSKHNYHEVYEKLFLPLKDKFINMLEIGVYKGSSTMAHHDYFKNGTIHGLDLFHRTKIKEIIASTKDRIILTKGDSTNPKIANKLSETQYDIIIDDGAHYPKANRLSFENTKKLLAPNGIYIIEDVWPLEKMSVTEMNNSWVKKHPERYNMHENHLFLQSLENSRFEIERFDLREKSGNPDSYIILLKNTYNKLYL